MPPFVGWGDDLELDDLTPGDYFKIGVAHAEQNVPQDPAYIGFKEYLDGYAFGLAMKPNLFQRRDNA